MVFGRGNKEMEGGQASVMATGYLHSVDYDSLGYVNSSLGASAPPSSARCPLRVKGIGDFEKVYLAKRDF